MEEVGRTEVRWGQTHRISNFKTRQMGWWGCSPQGLSPYYAPGARDDVAAGPALLWPLPPARPPHADLCEPRHSGRWKQSAWCARGREGSAQGGKRVCRDGGLGRAGLPRELLQPLRQASTTRLVAGTPVCWPLLPSLSPQSPLLQPDWPASSSCPGPSPPPPAPHRSR